MKIEINLPNKQGGTTLYDDLSNVYVLDYNDNYHKRDDGSLSDIEREVRTLKGRYRDIIKFNEALLIYNEYMEHLADKYGNADILKKMVKNGLVDDYVPRKPRLKNTKTLKYLYKHKIIVSPSTTNYKIKNNEEFDEYMDTWFPDDNYIEPTVTIRNDKLADKISSKFTTSPYFKSYSFQSDAQYLENYFANKNKSKKNSKKKKNKSNIDEDPFLLTDWLNGCYTPSENNESDNSYSTPYGTLLLSGSRTREMEMYHRINDCGWNSYKIMKNSNYSKRERELFKPVKKAKKKKKNKGKNAMREMGLEDSIVQIFEDMGYDDFEDYRKEMLSMTSDDLFN